MLLEVSSSFQFCCLWLGPPRALFSPLSNKIFLWIYHLSYARYSSHAFRHAKFKHPNNIWWIEQIMKLLTVIFSSFSHYFPSISFMCCKFDDCVWTPISIHECVCIEFAHGHALRFEIVSNKYNTQINEWRSRITIQFWMSWALAGVDPSPWQRPNFLF